MYVHHWRHPGVFIVNFEHLSCLVFLLFILSRYVPAGFKTAGIYLFKVNNGTMRRMHGICFSRKETFYVKIFCSVVSLPTLTRFQFKLFLDTGYLSVFRPNGGKYGPGKLLIRTLYKQCQMCLENYILTQLDIISEHIHLISLFYGKTSFPGSCNI